MKVAIEDTKGNDHVLDIEEGERQMIILSLALCSLIRPGFLEYTRGIGAKLHGGDPKMFDDFRTWNPNVKPVDPVACPQHPPK